MSKLSSEKLESAARTAVEDGMGKCDSCRPGCGACCIAPSISSPIPGGMPEGKPAGVPCVNLDSAYRCRIFGHPDRPAVCASLRPSPEMCGSCREEALAYLEELERLTAPTEKRLSPSVEFYVPDPEEFPLLLDLWEASVRASHHFLTERDIAEIRSEVSAFAFSGVKLFCLGRRKGEPSAFMGISGKKLEMLFVHPDRFGCGAGKRLLSHAIEQLGVLEVDVNEQSGQALAFYRHFGFEIAGRSERDSSGRPFPILHLKLKPLEN